MNCWIVAIPNLHQYILLDRSGGWLTIVWQIVVIGQGIQTRAFTTFVSWTWCHELVGTLVADILGCGVKWWWAEWQRTNTLWRCDLSALEALDGLAVESLEVEQVWERCSAGHEAADRQELHREEQSLSPRIGRIQGCGVSVEYSSRYEEEREADLSGDAVCSYRTNAANAIGCEVMPFDCSNSGESLGRHTSLILSEA